MLQDDFNYYEDNPQDVYLQTQINTLNDLEGIHEYQPDKSALVISVTLSVIETAIAFTMIAPAGIFIGAMVSLFPVVLLWAIANHHAEKVELPEAYDELVEKYHEVQK